MSETGQGRPIVVGVDGSAASLEALRWAARQARLTGAPLLALTAWAFPEHPTPFGIVPDIPLPPDELDQVRARLEETTRAVVGADDVVVRSTVVPGDAATVLLRAAEDAQLLVVGSRGRGTFAGVLLGSVSAHVAHHAPCPVVVVRPRAG
jgi:nucleotide-binding universal stress UspA family protein